MPYPEIDNDSNIELKIKTKFEKKSSINYENF